MDSQMDNSPVGGARQPDGSETGVFLDRLLARADDAGPAHRGTPPDTARLRTALMHCTELHALRQRKEPPRTVGHRTFKHVFLLPDGTAAVLWEVEHNTDPDGRTRHRLYTDRAAADDYVRERFGEPPLLDLWPRFAAGEEPGGGRPGGRDGDSVLGSLPMADPGSWNGPGRMIAEIFFPTGRTGQQRGRRGRTTRHDYESDHSAEHARRVLRRAENDDRPGETVRQLLHSAVGHETTLVTLRQDAVGETVMEWALYQHAFLLADGTETSLWEVEHTGTPDGHPVCEVYLDEDAARDSAGRHRAGS